MRKLWSFFVSRLVSSRAEAQDPWGLATSEVNGKPVIYRYILNPPTGVRTSDYPNLIAIAWEFDASVHNGLPDRATNTRMIELEELLDQKL